MTCDFAELVLGEAIGMQDIVDVKLTCAICHDDNEHPVQESTGSQDTVRDVFARAGDFSPDDCDCDWCVAQRTTGEIEVATPAPDDCDCDWCVAQRTT